MSDIDAATVAEAVARFRRNVSGLQVHDSLNLSSSFEVRLDPPLTVKQCDLILRRSTEFYELMSRNHIEVLRPRFRELMLSTGAHISFHQPDPQSITKLRGAVLALLNGVDGARLRAEQVLRETA